MAGSLLHWSFKVNQLIDQMKEILSDSEIKIIENALLKVARNVTKHFTTRSGFSEDDECFGIELREAESEIFELIKIKDNEIKRLKEGNFTSEELQNLCHNLTNCDLHAFAEGCKREQEKLFGKDRCEIYRKQHSAS